MASGSQDRLDEILTAATDYRQELAREIRERADALSAECSRMLEAATILDGKAGSRSPDPDEVKKLRRQVEDLGTELSQAKMEAERAKAARARSKDNGPTIPLDAPTVLLRGSGRAEDPNAQLVFSVPVQFRDGIKDKVGKPWQVGMHDGMVLFQPLGKPIEEAAKPPAKAPAKEVAKSRPKPVPTIQESRKTVTEEMVRDIGIEKQRFTVKDLADELNVSYWQVYRFIPGLVKKGIFARDAIARRSGFKYEPPAKNGSPKQKPRGEPDLRKLGVGSESATQGVVVPHTRPVGSSGKPGRDKKTAQKTGRRVIRRGEKRH